MVVRVWLGQGSWASGPGGSGMPILLSYLRVCWVVAEDARNSHLMRSTEGEACGVRGA